MSGPANQTLASTSDRTAGVGGGDGGGKTGGGGGEGTALALNIADSGMTCCARLVDAQYNARPPNSPLLSCAQPHTYVWGVQHGPEDLNGIERELIMLVVAMLGAMQRPNELVGS